MKKLIAKILTLALVILPMAGATPAGATAPANWDTTGNYVVAFNYQGNDYNHDMSLAQDGSANLTGNGGNPAGGAHVYSWVLTSGTVSADTIEFLANYTASADAVTPQTVMHVLGTVAPDGSISGTWSDNYQGGERGGTFRTVSGAAVALRECDTSSKFIVSDSQTQDITDGHNAAALTFIHSGWTASIPGATWIWATDPVELNGTTDLTKKFAQNFTISGTPQSGILDIAADNNYTVRVNGDAVPVVADDNNFQLATQDQYDVTPFLVNGVNRIEIAVTNKNVAGVEDPSGNPAGLMYKLTYNKKDCAPIVPNSISGMKFNDLNKNGHKDANEPGLAGWTIRLIKNGLGGSTISTTTDANGNYSFSNLVPGVYSVRETHQNGWKRRSKNPKMMVLLAGSVVTNVNFGNSVKLSTEKEDTTKDDDKIDLSATYFTHHETSNYETDQSLSSHSH